MPWEKTFDVTETLGKAMHAFWSRGYEATSMQDIVDCTGINRGSLYATYGDKRSIFLAALRMYDEKVRRRLLADLEAHCPPREAIRQVLMAFVADVSGARDNKGCLLVNTALELAPHDPEIRRIVANSQREIEAFFTRTITRAQSLGEISASVNPSLTARGLLASLIGIVVLTRSRPELALLHGIVDDALSRLG